VLSVCFSQIIHTIRKFFGFHLSVSMLRRNQQQELSFYTIADRVKYLHFINIQYV